MKRFISILVLIGVVSVVGYGIFKKREPEPPTVKTVVVRRGEIKSWVEEVGRVESASETTIFAKTDWIVEKVLLEIGDEVKKGEELVRFDLREAENGLAQATNRLKEARLNLEETRRELDRTRELYQAKASSRLKLDAARTRYEQAIIRLNISKKEIEAANIHLERLKVTSPQDGVVLAREVEDNQTVSPAKMLFVIADPGDLEVVVDVDEVDAGQVRVGQEAIITTLALPDSEFKGKVTEIAPRTEVKEKANIVEVTLSLDKTDGLKIGNQVDVRIITGRKQDVPLLPLEALSEGENFVFVYQKGVAYQRKIATGISNLEDTEITAGLKEGDEVIIPAGLKLKDWNKVRKRQ